ncbi:MAG: putative 2-aminoethylphosphonate ABC transporter substrate-binding protein [Deferribacterales bacterium]
MKKLLLMLMALLTFAMSAMAGEITVYTALEDDQYPVYLESFKQQHPEIKLNIVRDSTGIITARLLAEKANPQADVVWGLAATSLLVLDNQKLLAPYAPKGVERVMPQFKDKAKTPAWVGIDAWMTSFTVNTAEMQKRGLPVPTGYADLIKPEYKGLITMPNPASSGTGFLTVSAWLQLFKGKKGWDYMEKLHQNIALYTHSGSKPSKMAATGEYPIGISFGYRGLTEMKKGAPVTVVFPKEGSGWDLEANALIKKKNISADAKAFLDWAISDTVMTEYNKNFAIVTVKNNNPVPAGYVANPLKQIIKNDFSWAATNRDSILKEWSARFDAKSEPKK